MTTSWSIPNSPPGTLCESSTCRGFSLSPHNLYWLRQNGQRDGFGQINNEYVYYKLEAMVRPELKENGFFDKIFKREFSTANGHVAAQGIVPEGAHIVSLYQGRPPLCSPGDEFYFRIARCHLAEGWNDFYYASGKETNPRLF